MHVIVSVLLIIAMLSGCGLQLGCKLQQRDPAEYAMQYVCGVMETGCELQAPTVRYADLTGLQNWYGYFWFDRSQNTVWLDLQFEKQPFDPLAMSVLIHETVHYVDINMHGPQKNCDTEGKAFAISNVWLLSHGHPELARWDWQVQYQCPAPRVS